MKQIQCVARLLALGLVISGSTSAETFRDERGVVWELSGFIKAEATRADTPARRQANPYTIDARNAFTAPDVSPVLGSRSSSLALQQFSLGASYETDSALALEARLSYRWRSEAALDQWFKSPDVAYRSGDGLDETSWFERLVGVSRPDLGQIRYGTQLSRAWARSDSFSYPIGLANQWAGSGAAFGVLPEALRLTSRTFEDGRGKFTAEVTLARDRLNTANVAQSRFTTNQTPFSPGPTEPQLLELFLQYSVPGHLVEFVMQSGRGAHQSSFGKSALVGWIGDPDTLNPLNIQPRQAGRPAQSVAMLQGNHWPNPQNMLTYGVRYSRWSGSAASCNFDVDQNKCIYVDPGFNYGDSPTHYSGFRGASVDGMLGWSHYSGLYTYTAGLVWFGRATSDNPIEWGQSNSAVSTNLGLHRKLPELYKGASIYGGLGWSRFAKLGPAPLSMPDNLFLGVNPLYDRSGAALTVGFNIVF